MTNKTAHPSSLALDLALKTLTALPCEISNPSTSFPWPKFLTLSYKILMPFTITFYYIVQNSVAQVTSAFCPPTPGSLMRLYEQIYPPGGSGYLLPPTLFSFPPTLVLQNHSQVPRQQRENIDLRLCQYCVGVRYKII